CYPVGDAASFHALSRVPSPPSNSSSPAPPPSSSSKSPDNRTTPSTRSSYWWSPPRGGGSGSGDYKAPWPPWETAPRVPTVNSPPVVVTPTTTAPKTAATP